MRDRRAYSRFEVGESGFVRRFDDSAPSARRPAVVSDVSESGLGLQLDHPIPVGAQIEIIIGGSTLSGSVVYCRHSGQSYRAGIAYWTEHFPS